MKVGLRTPSLKKSVKARTTGRIKRSVKRSIDPTYGKKGVGYIKNPERAIKNHIYHKVTVDAFDSLKHKEYDGYDPDIDNRIPEQIEEPEEIKSELKLPRSAYWFSTIGGISAIYCIYNIVFHGDLKASACIIGLVCYLVFFRIKRKYEN